jgi:hypothetical protein
MSETPKKSIDDSASTAITGIPVADLAGLAWTPEMEAASLKRLEETHGPEWIKQHEKLLEAQAEYLRSL